MKLKLIESKFNLLFNLLLFINDFVRFAGKLTYQI